MARTALTVQNLTPNAAFADPAGTAIDVANGMEVSGVPLEELVFRVVYTFAGAKNFIVRAGDSPPALEAGVGDLTVSINNAVRWVGPLTSGRFMQGGADGGKVQIDFEAASTGTITAFRMPRSA